MSAEIDSEQDLELLGGSHLGSVELMRCDGIVHGNRCLVWGLVRELLVARDGLDTRRMRSLAGVVSGVWLGLCSKGEACVL